MSYAIHKYNIQKNTFNIKLSEKKAYPVSAGRSNILIKKECTGTKKNLQEIQVIC